MAAKVRQEGDIDKAMDMIDIAARGTLVRAGGYLAQRMRDRIMHDNKSASGGLEKSIEVSTVERAEPGWTIRVGPKAAHAKYVVHGRRAGAKMPPVQAIENWILQRGLSIRITDARSAENAVRSAAFAIARSIAKYGIDPYPFVHDVYKDEKQLIKVMIRDDMKAALRSIKRTAKKGSG